MKPVNVSIYILFSKQNRFRGKKRVMIVAIIIRNVFPLDLMINAVAPSSFTAAG